MFTSPDLRSWSFAGRALSRHGDACGPEGGEWSGSVWECPVLVRVGGRTALVVSVWVPGVPQHLAYAFVEEDGDRLLPGEFRRLSYGPSLYAASTFTDADGEPGLIAWLREVGDADAGWMGAHSLPYRVRLEGDSLVVAPPPAVATRRRGPVGPGELPAVADLEWSPGTGAWLEADTSFRVDAGEGTLRVTAGAYDVDLPWSGETLRLVLDGPVLEVFGRRGVLAVPVDSGTGRVDASDADALTVYPLG
jgi:beta-fructofuranosidase